MENNTVVTSAGRSRPWGVMLTRPAIVWYLTVAVLIGLKLLTNVVPVTFRSAGQENLLDWQTIGVFTVLGLIGAILASRTGFPEPWTDWSGARRRILWPASIGIGFGVVAVFLDRQTGGTQAIAQITGQPSFNIDFPGSLIAYFGGAILIEAQYRLIPIPILLWLTSNVLLRGRWQTPIFWALAAITSLFEPVLQGVGLTILGGGVITPVMLAAYLVTALPLNILYAVFFRTAGFLSMIVLRSAYYVVWHIIYGNFLAG